MAVGSPVGLGVGMREGRGLGASEGRSPDMQHETDAAQWKKVLRAA